MNMPTRVYIDRWRQAGRKRDITRHTHISPFLNDPNVWICNCICVHNYHNCMCSARIHTDVYMVFLTLLVCLNTFESKPVKACHSNSLAGVGHVMPLFAILIVFVMPQRGTAGCFQHRRLEGIFRFLCWNPVGFCIGSNERRISNETLQAKVFLDQQLDSFWACLSLTYMF